MPQYGITSGLPQLPVTDDKLFPYLLPIYNAINALAKPIAELKGQVEYAQSEISQRNQIFALQSQFQNRLFVKALVTLPYGTMVNVVLDSGKLAGRLADATDTTKPAHGVVANPQGINAGQFGEVTMMQGHTFGIAGTTIGAFYWLSTAGLVQNTPPGTPGNLIQGVGVGLGSAGFYLSISSQLQVA